MYITNQEQTHLDHTPWPTVHGLQAKKAAAKKGEEKAEEEPAVEETKSKTAKSSRAKAATVVAAAGVYFRLREFYLVCM